MKKILFILLLPLTLFGQSQKISDMTSATTLAGTEYVPIVQTTNKKATVSLLRGFGSYGTAGQLLKVNSGATGFDFFTPSYLTALTNGNGTTANGTAVDLGGALTGNVAITGSDFTITQTLFESATSSTDFIWRSYNDGGNDYKMTLGAYNFQVRDNGNTHNFIDILSGDFNISSLFNLSLGSASSPSSMAFTSSGLTLNLGSDATGDTYYRNSSGYLTRLAAGTNGHVLTLAAGIPSWAAPSGGGALSALTAATGSNTINNAANAQEWQWNTLGAGTGLLLSSSSTAAASNTNTLFRANQTGANATSTQTTYGGYFSNTKTGTSSTNIGLYSTATGGTTNWSIYGLGNIGLQIGSAPSATRQGFTLFDNTATERGFLGITSSAVLVGSGSGYPLYLYGGGTLSGAITTTGKWQVMDSPDNTSRAKLYVTHAINNTTPVLRVDGAIDTNLTASTEKPEVDFNFNRNKNFATGALTTQREFIIRKPTYSFTGASTITNAYTMYVNGGPSAGSNATITNSWAAGFGGSVTVGSSDKILQLTDGSSNELFSFKATKEYEVTQTNAKYQERQSTGTTSATTFAETIYTSSDISDGQSVTIEVLWTAKDSGANTGAGGIFYTTWTKASGTLAKAGDNQLVTNDNMTGSWALSTSDSSGNISLVFTGTGVANTEISFSTRIIKTN